MKKCLLCLITLFAFVFCANAQDTSTTNIPETRLHISEKPGRPRTPFVEEINCYYNNGSMSFSSSDYLGYISVEITSLATGETSCYTLYAETDSIPVALPQGSYLIACRTEQDLTYIGVLDTL